jgi:hypothetical protein
MTHPLHPQLDRQGKKRVPLSGLEGLDEGVELRAAR